MLWTVTQTRLDAPAGRHWPSDVDQIMRDGWMDSDEAARAALAAAQEKDAGASNEEIQHLSFRARRMSWPRKYLVRRCEMACLKW